MKQTIEQLKDEHDRLQDENVQLRNYLIRLQDAAKDYWEVANYDGALGSMKRYRRLEKDLLDLLGMR